MFSHNYPPMREDHLTQWWLEHSQATSSLSINHVMKCESTNAQLYNMSQRHNTLLVTERQTKGKGQFERVWISQRGDLTFSIGLLVPIKKLHCLSLKVGLALVQHLEKEGLSAQLKWPNDVIVHHSNTEQTGKLAGILIQTQINQQDETAWVVIGVGLNIVARLPSTNTMQPIGLAQLSEKWEQPNTAEREILLMRLVESIFLLIEKDDQHNFTEQWNQHDLWRNSFISFIDPQGVEHHGKSLGINIDGAYQLKMSDDTLRVFHSGQLRPFKERL